MAYSYEDIQAFLEHAEIDGSRIICEFRTPDGEIVEASARIRKSRSVKSEVQRKVTRVVTNRAKRQASRLVRDILGGGMAGRIGSSVVRSSMSGQTKQFQFTEEDKQEAIVKAFKQVADQFDLEDGRKSGRRGRREKESTTFPRTKEHLKKNKVRSAYDKEVLARMLVQIAQADGDLSDDELDLLDSFVGDRFGSVEDLLEKDPLSKVECEEVEDAVKGSLFLLAWIMALADGEVASAERELLHEFGALLALPNDRQVEFIQTAKMDVLESLIDPDISRDDLFAQADRLGLEHEQAERCLVQLKKRG